MDSRLILSLVAIWLVPALALATPPQRSGALEPVLDAAIAGETWLILDEAYNRGLKVSTPDALYSLSGNRLQAVCATRLDGLCLCFLNRVYRLDGIIPADGDAPARLQLTWLLDAPVPAAEQVTAFSREGTTWLFTTRESMVVLTPGSAPEVIPVEYDRWYSGLLPSHLYDSYSPGNLAYGQPAPCLVDGRPWLATPTELYRAGAEEPEYDFHALLAAEPYGVRFGSVGDLAAVPLGGNWFAYDGPDTWFILNGSIGFGRGSLGDDRPVPALVAVCPGLAAAELIKCGPAEGIPWLLVSDGTDHGLLTVEVRNSMPGFDGGPFDDESSAHRAQRERFDRPYRFTYEELTFQPNTYVAGYTFVKHTATVREHPVVVLAPPVIREYDRTERGEYEFDQVPY